MARIPSLSRTLSTSIPLARGLADRAVTTARPIVFGVAGRITGRLTRRSPAEPSMPETFTPSPAPAVAAAAADRAPEPAVADVAVVADATVEEKASGPTPASIARNVAAPRPTVAAPVARKPRSAPGAKLPVRRPSPST